MDKSQIHGRYFRLFLSTKILEPVFLICNQKGDTQKKLYVRKNTNGVRHGRELKLFPFELKPGSFFSFWSYIHNPHFKVIFSSHKLAGYIKKIPQALRSRKIKNPDVSTEPLARPFTLSLAPLTCTAHSSLLAPHCSLCSCTPLRSLARSLCSLPRLWVSEWMSTFFVFFFSRP